MPPGEIPVEASDMLAFTPESLRALDNPPVFRLRAVTRRDKRAFRRFIREAGIIEYDDQALRATIRSELRRLWTPEDFDREMPRIEAWWETLDDWLVQVKDDPELVLEFDADERDRIARLLDRLVQASPDLLQMRAANEDAAEQRPIHFVRTAVAGFSGLETRLAREEGYLTEDCAADVAEALLALGKQVDKNNPRKPWSELLSACYARFSLSKDQEKNSASPSPSEEPQQSSKNGAASSEKAGTSPESDG